MLSLDILRIIVPAANASVLLLTFLFRSLARLNDSVSGYKPVKEDDDKEITEPRKRPRRVLLLLPLLALALTYFGDGGLLIHSIVSTKQRSDIGIFYAIASLATFWTCSMMLLAGEETEGLPIFLVVGLCEREMPFNSREGVTLISV